MRVGLSNQSKFKGEKNDRKTTYRPTLQARLRM